MKHAATIKFEDLDENDEALVIVRYDEGRVVLGLSLRTNGDLQVVMNKESARQVILALTEAAR
jgi:hypothetical protein